MKNENLTATDEFEEAVNKVKAGAAAVSALYVADTSITYTPELLDVIATQLHEAARYFDGIMTEE